MFHNSYWKIGRLEKSYVTPIHKNDDKKDPENYCPVSLTTILFKIMESIIKYHLLEYLKDNILSNKSYGSLHGRSSLVITKCFRTVDRSY